MRSLMRATLAMVIAGTGTFATIGGAAAFEPPSDPAGQFSCPGGDPVAGHPGARGLLGVVSESRLGPWNAVFAESTPLTLC